MSDKESTHSDPALENPENVVEDAVVIESDSDAKAAPKKVKWADCGCSV